MRAIKSFKKYHEVLHMVKKDRILKRVFKSEASYYCIYTNRLVLEDDHQLNFIDVEATRCDDVRLELELGLMLPAASEVKSVQALD